MFEEAIQWLRDVREEPLAPISLGGLLGALVPIIILAIIALTSEEGWVPILDSLNLVFHESGHPLFGVFGETVGFLGGTLMQLIVPLLVVAAGWYKRQAIAIGLSGVWFFENFLNIARYMADARAQLLPLVGGGEHDWAYLFGRWGLLASDTAIAHAARALGWIGMAGCTGWIVWRWYRDRRSAP